VIPRATYRFQFNRDFPFARAEELVPYLNALGISHIYASPISTACSGSTHGYDVVDPTRVNPELGGEKALRSLVAALRERDMGLIVDIVPNHMGITGGENAWWNDVLAKGQASPFARYFDISWTEKLLLPFLGEPLADALENGSIELKRDDGGLAVWAYGQHRFPVRPEDQDAALDCDIADLLERQHYTLAWWRQGNDELRWRRFFTVTALASLRMEDPEVFEAVHALYFRLHEEELIDGVRIDHVDGLADPAAYCRRLRERLGPEAYIVVEKILASGEQMPPEWNIDGTSGYDFMEQVSAVLHDPAGEEPLSSEWAELSGRPADFEAEELQARQDMLSWEFEGQLSACVRAFTRLAESDPQTLPLTEGMLRRALRVLLWVFPVYRTYGTGSEAPPTDQWVREIARERAEPHAPPGEMPVIEQLLAWLAGEGPGDPEAAREAVRRFQQLSAPIAAKAVEDTAFYRYGRLLSRNDVGFDPARFAFSAEEFHEASCERGDRFPAAMLATATHDHKRGEDVRARLAVLSAIPRYWIERVGHWEELAGAAASEVDPADRYMLYQTLFGAWPEGLRQDDDEGLRSFAERVSGWQEKALREAKLRSSWTEPDEAYEKAARGHLERLLDAGRSAAFLADICDLVRQTEAAALANTLAQVALKLTVRGVPDFYQGTELSDLSLVDPDNRRPVDYASRQAMLDQTEPASAKFVLIRRLLEFRRQVPDLFRDGSYQPLEVSGARSPHVIAFQRKHQGAELTCVVAIRCGAELFDTSNLVPPPQWWGDTAVAAGPTGEAIQAPALFNDGPVFTRLVMC